MSEHNTHHEEQIVDAQGALDFINKNQTVIIGVLSAVLVLVIGYVGVKQYYLPEQDAKAQVAIFEAQALFEKDSFNLALNGNAEIEGFNDIISDYGMTRTGNLAHYYAGICNLKMGNYDEAISQLDKFDADDMVLGAMALGTKGDAYAEKGDLSKAISQYEKAASYNDNEFTAPMFLLKAALAKDVNGNSEAALKDLKALKKAYPKFDATAKTVDKHIARLEQK